MDAQCKAARLALRTATRSEYEAIIHEAKLTPLQDELLRRHILQDESICKAAIETHCSERKVRRLIHKAYLSVSLLLPLF